MKLKFLIVIPVPSSFLPGLIRATSYLGINTLIFNSRGHNYTEKIITFTKGNNSIAKKMLNDRLIKAAYEYKPDVLLVMKGELITVETVNAIKNFGVKTINWFPDGLWAIDLITKIVSGYDIFLHFDSLVSERLQKKGYKNVRYLPYAADLLPKDKTPFHKIKRYETVFIGNYYPERENYFKKIANKDFYLWGDKSWKNTGLSANYQGICQFTDVAKTLSESRVGINLHYQRAKSNGANLRVYESTAAGACLLTDYKKDLEKLYDLGKDILIFKNPEEFSFKVKELNHNYSLSQKIGRNGYFRTINQNTYVHRFRDIIKMI